MDNEQGYQQPYQEPQYQQPYQQPYQQQPYQQYPQQAINPPEKFYENAIFSLIASIICTLLCCMPAGIIALVLSIISLSKKDSDIVQSRKFSKYAMIICLIGIILIIIAMIIYIALIATGSLDDYLDSSY